eukprot:5617410-Pleurochrysis_carterae.AAC.1
MRVRILAHSYAGTPARTRASAHERSASTHVRTQHSAPTHSQPGAHLQTRRSGRGERVRSVTRSGIEARAHAQAACFLPLLNGVPLMTRMGEA